MPFLRAKQLTYGSSNDLSPLNITLKILRVIEVAQIECKKFMPIAANLIKTPPAVTFASQVYIDLANSNN